MKSYFESPFEKPTLKELKFIIQKIPKINKNFLNLLSKPNKKHWLYLEILKKDQTI